MWLEEELLREVSHWGARIDEIGGELYLVGGSVRDRLLGRSAYDLDFCVTGITQEVLQTAFPEAFMTGRAFPVYRMRLGNGFAELALARTERKTGTGHRGFQTVTTPQVRIEDDLFRRDLTINALALHVRSGTLIDPYGGQSDLQAGVLRAVSSAFAEDPLRVYRTARFAAQFAFTVETRTLQLMAELRDELSTLSAERVFMEMRKALMSKTPSQFFDTLRMAGVLGAHFPELSALVDVVQLVRYHPEGDAYQHTLQVLDVTAQRERKVEVRYAALVHDFGKGLTPRAVWPAHPGHEKRGVALANQLSKRLLVPTAWKRGAAFATEFHMLLHQWNAMKPSTIVDLYAKAKRQPLGVQGFAYVCEADACGRNRMQEPCAETDEWLKLWNLLESQVNGATLAFPAPGEPDAKETNRTKTTAEEATKKEKEGREFGEALRRARIAYVRAYLRATYMPT